MILNVVNLQIVYNQLIQIMNVNNSIQLYKMYNINNKPHINFNISYKPICQHNSIIDFIFLTFFLGNDFTLSTVVTSLNGFYNNNQ